jgi:hypothetical protein
MLFGSVAEGGAKAKFDLHTRVLDHMADDVRRLQKRVSTEERAKLEFHVETIEEMEHRRQALAKMEPQIRGGKPELTDRFSFLVPIDRLAARFDIAAGALIAGLSKVVTIRTDGLRTPYSGLGIAGTNVHGSGHGVAPKGFESPDEFGMKDRKLPAALQKGPLRELLA